VSARTSEESSRERCDRWASVADADALGEPLAPEDRSFLEEHPRTCEACRAEASTWAALGAMVDAPTIPLAPEPPTRAPEHEERAPEKARPGRVRWVGALIALGAAAAAAVSFVVPRAEAPRPVASASATLAAPAPAVGPEHAVALSLTSGGAAEIDGREARLGAVISKGSVLFARGGEACVVVDPSVRACLEKGSMVRVADVGDHRRLELLRGRVVAELDPQPAGTSFGITTREGSAVAIGTAFAVEVPEGDAPVATRVLHGVVLVRSGLGQEQRVGAHQGTTMRSDAPRTSTNAEEERDRALAAPLPSLTMAAVAEPVRFVSQAPGSQAMVDDRIVGVTPLAILLPPGDHTVVVRSAQAETRTTVHVSGAPRAEAHPRTIDVAPTAVALAPKPAQETGNLHTFPAPPAAPEASASVPPEGPRAADLLATARERRGRGDTDGAVAAYRELFARHPNAPEARAALVPFGEMQLGKLGDAHGALGSFERYLTLGGPLAEEATFGKIRALRALGRAEEERATTLAFLKAYPDSTLAPSLRASEPRRP